MKHLLAIFLLLNSLIFPHKPYSTTPDKSILSNVHHSAVIIFMMSISNDGFLVDLVPEGRGSGTVYKVDDKGTWVLTAAHLKQAPSKAPDYYVVVFEDGTSKVATPALIFNRSDEMILHVPDFKWKYHVNIKQAHLGEPIWMFDWKSDGSNFQDTKVHKNIDSGIIVEGPIVSGMGGYENPELVRYWYFDFTTMLSHPGMSGGGVFDYEGNLVAELNGGSEIDSVITPILDSVKYEGLTEAKSVATWIPDVTQVKVLDQVKQFLQNIENWVKHELASYVSR